MIEWGSSLIIVCIIIMMLLNQDTTESSDQGVQTLTQRMFLYARSHTGKLWHSSEKLAYFCPIMGSVMLSVMHSNSMTLSLKGATSLTHKEHGIPASQGDN